MQPTYKHDNASKNPKQYHLLYFSRYSLPYIQTLGPPPQTATPIPAPTSVLLADNIPPIYTSHVVYSKKGRGIVFIVGEPMYRNRGVASIYDYASARGFGTKYFCLCDPQALSIIAYVKYIFPSCLLALEHFALRVL